MISIWSNTRCLELFQPAPAGPATSTLPCPPAILGAVCNVQIDVNTKQPIVFDSCAFSGHNESQHPVGQHLLIGIWLTGYVVVDLQNMGDPRYIFGMDFIDMYKNEIVASEPQQDFNDHHHMVPSWGTSIVARQLQRCAHRG